MKDLSLNILDIAENSVKAKATLTEITVTEADNRLVLVIADDGVGMNEETVKMVTDPFYTTRKTRSVGLGIPLLKLSCEQTGGSLTIESSTDAVNHGTTLTAVFFKDHIDFTPLGDVISSITTLIHGHPDTDFLFIHKIGDAEIRLDTRELREVLEDVPLDTYEVILWIRDNLREQYEESKK